MVAINARSVSTGSPSSGSPSTTTIAVNAIPVLHWHDGDDYTLISPAVNAPSAYVNSRGTMVVETWTAVSVLTHTGSTTTRTSTISEEVVIILGPFTSWTYEWSATRSLSVISTLANDRVSTPTSSSSSSSVSSTTYTMSSTSAATTSISPTSSSTPSTSHNKTPLIVGLAVGLPLGLLFLASVIALFVFLQMRRSRAEHGTGGAPQRKISNFNARPFGHQDEPKSWTQESFGAQNIGSQAPAPSNTERQNTLDSSAVFNRPAPEMRQAGRRSFETGDDEILPMPFEAVAHGRPQQASAMQDERDAVSPLQLSAEYTPLRRSRWRDSADGEAPVRDVRRSSRYIQDELHLGT